MPIRSQQIYPRRSLLPFLAAVIAALAAILTGLTAPAAATVGAENRVGAISHVGEVLVAPPQHESPGQRLGSSVAGPFFVVATGVAANGADDVIRGTNARGLVNSRGSFRKATLDDAWDNAASGPTGGRLCPSCGGEVSVPPHTGVPRDWDASHFPSWTNREFPSTITRGEVLDNYNKGIFLECPICNRLGGNNDARFWR